MQRKFFISIQILFAYTFVLVHNCIPHHHHEIVNKVEHHHHDEHHHHENHDSKHTDHDNSTEANDLDKVHFLLGHTDNFHFKHSLEDLYSKVKPIDLYTSHNEFSYKFIQVPKDKPPQFQWLEPSSYCYPSALSLRAPPSIA